MTVDALPSYLNWLLWRPAQRGEVVIQRLMKCLKFCRDHEIDLSKWSEAELRGALLVVNRIVSPRRVGRPKEHDDDVELVLSVELLSRRDGISYAEACKTIATPGTHRKI